MKFGQAIMAKRITTVPATGITLDRDGAAPLPWRLWARALGQRVRAGLAALPGERDPAGYLPLRAAIAAHLGMARGVRCAPEQVVVVAGAQAGFDLASRLLLDPG